MQLLIASTFTPDDINILLLIFLIAMYFKMMLIDIGEYFLYIRDIDFCYYIVFGFI